MMAVAKAISDNPLINISFDGVDKVIKHKNINIGMAAALPDGNLIVPVIQKADTLDLPAMATAVNDLATRSKKAELLPDEVIGGTYTVTNVGVFGTVIGSPIINQPQSAILALGAIRKMPRVITTEGKDTIAIRSVMYLSHSYDHRVINGALGGTNISKDRIVEIALLKIFPDGNKESKTLLVNPEIPIPEDAAKVHGCRQNNQNTVVLPTKNQVDYQKMETIGFIHFTTNTFTDKEWGYGDEDPQIFNPTDLNVEQWVLAAKGGGLKQLILTAKHHDGFCLWASKYTEHSVKNSPYKNGKGDVVREFVDACRKHGLKVGLYLSPWDRNHKDYGKPAYLTYYRNQLKELLTEYGAINEIWFDGANGGDGYYGGANETRKIDRKTYYDWENTFQMIKKIQPNIKIFSDKGPDVHWIGNEKGFAGKTFWSTLTNAHLLVGTSKTKYLNTGDPKGKKWIVGQCDVSIRPGWFYHKDQDKKVKTPQSLVDIYYKSVGRNAVLLLNLPPDRRGLIHEKDVEVLKTYKAIIDETFAENFTKNAKVTAAQNKPTAQNVLDGKLATHWSADKLPATLTLNLENEKTFDRIMLQEPIQLGQKISAFQVDVFFRGKWKKVFEGLLLVGCSQKNHRQKPNVIIMFIDDMGYGDIGCYGATGFETPNLDQMATQGMRFTNYYAAQPVCSASRAGLITGCYPNRIGFSGALFPTDTMGIHSDEYTMAEMFKDQGYATACFGKWHLGHHKKFLPLQHGFDEYVGVPYSNDMWPHNNVTGERLPKGSEIGNLPELPLISGDETIETITDLKGQDKLTTLYTEKALDFIDRNTKNPFFLYVPHSMSHIPLGVSEKFRGKSEQGMYGDVMMEIDWSVGEIMKALKKHNIADNTVFIFTTDNGPWLNFGNHAGSSGGLREGKTTSWEGGQRVPFIIYYPDMVPKGVVCNQLANAIDLLPTLASVTGGKLSDNKIDGVDISSLWKGDFDVAPRQSILYYYGKNHLNGVRKGNWKLVLPHTYQSYDTKPGNDGYGGDRIKKVVEKPELYNMVRDPGEQFNVIEYYPEKVAALMKLVEEARKNLGDLNVGMPKGLETREIGKL
uniref:alpha-L-fucosidase n=1 Tax=Stylophora pistillata TaxID=50429 RepID=A0A2B4REK2_STYPI